MSSNDNNDSHRKSVLLMGLLLGATSLAVYFGHQNQSLQVQAENLKAELSQQLQLQDVFTTKETGENVAVAVIGKDTKKMSRQLLEVNFNGLINDLSSEVNGLSDETNKFIELTDEYDGIIRVVEGKQATPSLLAKEITNDAESSNEVIHRHNNQLRKRERRLKGRLKVEITDNFPLDLCQGDCDNDDDCGDSLICFHRNLNQNLAVPGCTGGAFDNSRTDYCIDENQARIVAQNGEPANQFPLGLCEGECDTDSDCSGSLVCFHRERKEFLAVPGCTGGDDDKSRTDYCVENAAEGTYATMPQLEESVATLKIQRRALSSTNVHMQTLNLLMADQTDNLIRESNALKIQNTNFDGSQQILTDEVGELEDRASDLTQQIQDLSANNVDLVGQLDITENLNNQLEKNLINLTKENQILQANNLQHKSSNEELHNVIIPTLNNRINDLSQENIDFTKLNQKLDITNEDLNENLDELGTQVDTLTVTNDRLDSTVGTLNKEINSLNDSNNQLTIEIKSLSDANANFESNITQLENTNRALTNVASFLNETGSDIGDSLDSVVDFLDGQINVYRFTLLGLIENTYRKRITNWDCSYNNWFSDLPFGSNHTIAIPENSYTDVFEYVGLRVLDDLCLDTEDFAYYISELYTDYLTTNRLVSAVQSYTESALNYYFPDEIDGGLGLTKEEWAEANYDCDNLNTNQLYYVFSS